MCVCVYVCKARLVEFVKMCRLYSQKSMPIWSDNKQILITSNIPQNDINNPVNRQQREEKKNTYTQDSKTSTIYSFDVWIEMASSLSTKLFTMLIKRYIFFFSRLPDYAFWRHKKKKKMFFAHLSLKTSLIPATNEQYSVQ